MRLIRKRCLGLDLHKKQITAHLRVHQGSTVEPIRITEVFGTMPDQLEQLRAFVVNNDVTDVVMESTSVYWMHVYELLESSTRPAVVNASHVKKVPGRKTDVSDAEWLADLHAHGLLRPSFVPPPEFRELRTLTRYRTKLVQTRTAARNRTIKLVELAGVKLSSVVSDSFGATGRAILDALAHGEADPQKLAAKAHGTLRNKIAQLEQAVAHPLTDHQRQLLGMHLHAYDTLDAHIAELELWLEQRARPYAAQIELLDQIPGINALAAITMLAETGTDMSVYRTAGHLTALAGLAPGNAISSDRRRHISARKGNTHLRRICVQIAWAASRKKDSFLRTRFLRLQGRIGRNKAIIALARQILVILYTMLSNASPYHDLGAAFYDARDKDRAIRRYSKRLAALGFTVELTPRP